jgi:hypothetical protein
MRRRASVDRVMAALAPQLQPCVDGVGPSFAELQRMDGGFFRRGQVSSHRDELPDRLHRLFWSRPDNAAAMRWLGYGTADSPGGVNLA